MGATSLQTACSALLEGYRANPEFSARTLLVTVFGDSLRPHGGEAWIGNLAQLVEPLGINERLTRTSLNRLMGEGLLATRRQGRSSFYRITAAAQGEFASVEDRIYHRRRDDWDGRWVVVVELDLSPANRVALRQRLRWIGFASLAFNVMISPSGDDEAAAVVRELGVADSVAIFRGQAGGPKAELEDRRLAELTSGLAELVPFYEAFLERFTPLAEASGGDPDPELAFGARTLLVHAYRRITLREPELPAGLWPQGWIGDEAFRIAAKTWHRLFPAAEAHLEAVWAAAGIPLPPLDTGFTDRYTL